MNKKVDYVWVRVRTRSSAGCGEWMWKEVAIEGKSMATRRKQNAYLKAHCAEQWAEEYNTGGEHYRGIEYEIATPARHIIEAEIRHEEAVAFGAKETANRLRDGLSDFPQADMSPPRITCMHWPRCGCLKQGVSKSSCREPLEAQHIRLLRQAGCKCVKPDGGYFDRAGTRQPGLFCRECGVKVRKSAKV